MVDVWGALGQSLPAAATLTGAYTVPSGKNATVEAVICNRGAAAVVRLSHAISGAADTGAQYLLYDFAVAAGESKTTARFTMKATDVLRVYSDTGAVAFNVNGIEEDT